MQILLPEPRWVLVITAALLPAVLVVAAILGFKALGGFEQLDAARKRKKDGRP